MRDDIENSLRKSIDNLDWVKVDIWRLLDNVILRVQGTLDMDTDNEKDFFIQEECAELRYNPIKERFEVDNMEYLMSQLIHKIVLSSDKKYNDIAIKHDDGKLRMDLITPEMINGLAEVLTFGAKKYSDRNWEKGLDKDRLYAACMRHMNTWRGGIDLDDESGLHHLKHAFVTLGMLVTFIERDAIK